MDGKQLAALLRTLRLHAGLSQYELAAMLGEGRGRLAAYEQGRNSPPLELAARWALACGRELFVVLVRPGESPAAALPPEDQRLVQLVRDLSAEDRRLVEQLVLGLGPGRSPELREAVVRLVDLLVASAASVGEAERARG